MRDEVTMSCNLRIPLSVFAVAETEEKGEWCFKQNGKERCFATGGACQTMRNLAGEGVESGCEVTNTAPGGTYSK